MATSKKTDKTAKKSQKEDAEEATTVIVEGKTKSKEVKSTAKAGKRSAKANKEAEEKTAKEERKIAITAKEAKAEKPKVEQKSPRSRTERAGKKYREAAKQIDKSKTYNLAEAVDLATKTHSAKFDATVEMHVNLAVDPKQADQNIRDTVVMPHGTGKVLRVAVFAEGEDVAEAKKAGADVAGSDEILTKLDKEEISFDILISTPTLMTKLSKYAKLLGPKGLMPNPKSGTVTADVVKAVKEAKAGRLEYRVDESGIIHIGVGRVSFGPQKLLENAQTVVTSIRAAKPASIKGTYIKSAYITSTMGPSIKTEL